MITAWQVYWVMQLDPIRTLTTMFSLLGGIIGGISGMVSIAAKGDGNEEVARGATKVAKIAALIFVPAVLLATFLPSSKTAAAMILLPAITSHEVVDTVAPEARELYDLAKQALKNVVAPKAEPEKK